MAHRLRDTVSFRAGSSAPSAVLHAAWVFSKYLLRTGKKWEEGERREGEKEGRNKNKRDPCPKGRKFALVMLHTGC